MPSTAWLDAVLDCYFARRPVDATFIGLHDYDHRLPEVSEHGMGDALAALHALIATAEPEPAGSVEAVDFRLALGSVRLEIAELERRRNVANPAFYTGESVFGVMSLFLREHESPAHRMEKATARLAGVPAFLEQGMANVRSAPTEWTARALDECTGGLAFFGSGMETLIAGASRSGVDARALAACRRVAAAAAAAIERFGAYLDGHVRHRPDPNAAAAGRDLLSQYLREGHFLKESAQEIRDAARAALVRAEAEFGASLRADGLRTAAELDDRVASGHPPADGYLARFGTHWQAFRDIAIENDLVDWPETPLRYEPQPVWVRGAAPHLYFLPYRSPSALDAPVEHVCHVPPIENGSPERTESILRAMNDAVIRLNYVVHHGGLGHHVQNDFARRAPSRIGRIAAVDGASRIAFFCGGTMAEGWACYATDLMNERGALSPLERLVEKRSRIRMCARAVVDTSLHMGEMTIAQASAFYVQRAGMSPAAATVEAVKNSMFPGAALMYFVGRDAIHELRDEIQATLGSDFNLRSFHDALLSCGSVPVSIAGEAMRSVVRTTRRLPSGPLLEAVPPAPVHDGRHS